ncbi:RNA methyltransferase [Aquibium sp. LZ166]|uniref:RNA methyltransferase n=1 Tax=Aquibium pacificus TaxID=3153579 RepID=A0ABV3SMM1_9HYPH
MHPDPVSEASRLTRIDDPADERLAAYRDIRERDLVGREGRFVAEGKVVLNVLFGSSAFEAESVLILESRLDGTTDIIERVPPHVPIYVAGKSVLDAVAGYHVHRGVLAIGRRGEPPDLDRFLGGLSARAVLPILIGISNHDNVGAVFRNAAAFEAEGVLLDETSCDPLYRKSIRVSVGAALKVPFVRSGDAGSILTALARHGFECLALSPRGRIASTALDCRGRTAILLGSEGHGLPETVLETLRSVRIDMSAGFDSLNVAAASAIMLHQLWRRR